ncbi:MAG TPA: hypothetical protein VNJ09_04220 [Chthonomonadales bacterium]|nr:hypothetical protein [Chthonomonadales bacterium]
MSAEAGNGSRITLSEHILKWLGQLPALIMAGVAIATYNSTANQQRESLAASAQRQRESFAATARKERQQPFLQKQLELYFEASQTTAVLATSHDKTAWAKAYNRFWELYWGNLSIVESPYRQKEERAVEQKMVDYGGILKETGGDMSKLTEEQRNQLEQASLSLAHACRDDIQETWNFTSKEQDGP